TSATSATQGLVDRAVGVDSGLTTGATASDLLSVGARVTTVDASAMTGSANVRFVAKTNGSATDVAFTGGSAGDYVEFELGNVKASGGAGADTFAFITQAAGVTNSTYGSGDTISGGEGADTLQIGVNGQGTYTLSTTEFKNTTGVDVLDLRGATNTVTVDSTLVSGADAGKFEIHTDRIVQTSATDAANPAGGPNNAREDNSVNTVNLTDLTTSQGVKFVGGSGSDRLVLDNAAFNQKVDLAGGTNGGAPAAGDYDTLTVLNGAILSSSDLAHVSGFEGLVLAESGTGKATFSITLTAAFVLKNAAARNSGATSINDTIFQIGTAAAGNGNALEAGDTVTLDISDLLDGAGTALKATLGARQIDTSTLTAANVTVNYVVNGAAATAAQIALVTATDANAADVMNSAANMTGGVVAPTTGGVVAPVVVALTAGGSFTGTAGTNDTFQGTVASLNGTTVTGTAADTETLQLTDAGTVAINNGTTGGTVTNIDRLILANGTNTISFAAGSGITTVTGGTGADDVTLDTLAPTTSVNLGDGDDVLRASGTLTGTLNGGGGGADILTGTATAPLNISGATVSGFEVFDFSNSATPVTSTIAQFSGFSSFTNFDAGDGLTFSDAGAITLNPTVGTYGLANGTNTVDASSAADYSVTGGTGADTITFGGTLTAADTVAAGLGTDTLIVTGAATGSANITGVENILVNYGTAATFTTGAIAPGVASTIDASASTAAVTLDASAYVATTSLNIVGGRGDDIITVNTEDAQRALVTVSLATGGRDRVVISNTAADATKSAVTITGFTPGDDKVKFNGFGSDHGILTYQRIDSDNTPVFSVEANNTVIAIKSIWATSTSSDATNGGALETLLANAIGLAENYDYLAIVYGGGNAQLVHITSTAGGTDLTTATMAIEIVAQINGIAADSLSDYNFL
ncbi:MAG TPA: hypothetical protein DEV96_16520, partial [Rhodospirillum rubrum]|nr:hypothetical protein [Rhodospirillum rubrum]